MTSAAPRAEAFGDPEERAKAILAAASELLAEGGYEHLTMRAIARRSGMSAGLIYRYFADKRDVFATLLHNSQIELSEVLRTTHADSVEEFLVTVAPAILDQWVLIGRMAVPFVDRDRPLTSALAALHQSTQEQFACLEEGLRRSAEAQGWQIDSSPMAIRHVWVSLMGLAESLSVGWSEKHDTDELVRFTARALAKGIRV
ncbi:TetR/AcrR family transcriptional regulator [Enemella sp. A6]|uniref:TetR/AcrR family transcriptional regulator n=1 Tax=Enemella sp. A6 TaxID=3440152 RepID=UPI003EBBB84A